MEEALKLIVDSKLKFHSHAPLLMSVEELNPTQWLSVVAKYCRRKAQQRKT